jgi:SAM-dependent methyltransferase
VDDDDAIEFGLLRCDSSSCSAEFPILDGIPILTPDARGTLALQFADIARRDDLPPEMLNVIGEACGPGSPLDQARQRLSAYAWDHYGDLDPEERGSETPPGSCVELLNRGLQLLDPLPPGTILDLGCAVGRTSLELGRDERLVVGVDASFSLLTLARKVARRGWVEYGRRRIGLIYDARSFDCALPRRDRVDFWLADATAPPFPDQTFAVVVALNLLDCVERPLDVLRSMRRVLQPGGKLLLALPYDWNPSATPLEGWIGGRSSLAKHHGDGVPLLRDLLTPGAHESSVSGLEWLGSVDDAPWRVRSHDRHVSSYRVHLVAAEAIDD